MSSQSPTQLIIIIALVVLLGLSAAANIVLFGKAKDYYTREQHVRLTAVNRLYATENKHLNAPLKEQTRIILFGDSKCSQWSPLPNWENCEIINRGIGGETTAQIKERLIEDVINLKPQLVVFQAGVNDIKAIGVLPEQQDKITDDCVANISYICHTLNEHGIKVILTTIMPPAPIELARTPLWSEKVNQSVDTANTKLRKLASDQTILFDCDKYFRQGKHIQAKYSHDTLHLNQTGYQHWNQSLSPYVLDQTQN